MRSSTTSGHKIPMATYAYSPSVPLSVYRELATELQAAQAMLNALNAQNQQLAKHNHQLRQEIEKAVQSVLHLQRVVDATVAHKAHVYHPPNPRSEPSRGVHSPRSTPRVSRPVTSTQSIVTGPSPFPMKATGAVVAEKLFTEAEAGQHRQRFQPASATEVSGWKLAIAILLVMLTAFGAGYFAIRPLLLNR